MAPQIKKLSLDESKKTVLIAALTETADEMDKYMRRIYDETVEQVKASSDRIMLSVAQTGAVIFSLQHYRRAHGESREAEIMAAQLTMTRKEFQAMMDQA